MPQKLKVKEYIINDGIGAKIWRKLYAMSYAKHNNLAFEDTPIENFLIHESDQVYNKEEEEKLVNNLLSLIDNPWSMIDFSNSEEYTVCDKVGAGLEENQGIIDNKDFLSSATEFNCITDYDNSIVIHIRRGNVTEENPRWIEDKVYINLLNNIGSIIQKFNLDSPKVIVLTDAPDKEKYYTPVGNSQKEMWQQPYLNPTESGSYITTSMDFESLKTAYPNLQIVNRLGTYESFLLMIRAKVLVVSRSAFSQSAGLLSKNHVFEMFECFNGFKNRCGLIDQNGDIVFYK